MAEKILPLYSIGIDDIDFDAITAISLVDLPAIEKNFMIFAKKTNKNNFNFSKIETEKKIITGPALIPDKKIYRADLWEGEFEVVFSKEAIEKIRNDFLSNFKQKDIKIDHMINANNISVIESWIIEDGTNDKAAALGFENLPAGTWMISMKIDNDAVWKSIKDGDLKGFSIEAYFTKKIIEASSEKIKNELNSIEKENEELEFILKEIEDIMKNSKVKVKIDIKELDDIIKEL